MTEERIAQGPCPNCQEDLVACPHCGRIVRNEADVQQVVADGETYTSIGFRCPVCRRTFGHELPEPLPTEGGRT